MSEEPRVLVDLHEDWHWDPHRQIFLAKYVELGLAAGGSTHEEARTRLIALYRRTVGELRAQGKLAEWLDASGLPWKWAD